MIARTRLARLNNSGHERILGHDRIFRPDLSSPLLEGTTLLFSPFREEKWKLERQVKKERD